MKIILFIVLLCISNLSAQLHYYVFSELRGMENNTGHTQLFTREFTSGSSSMGYYYSNNIYRFDPLSGIETFFLQDGGFAGQYHAVNDYDFWEGNFKRYSYAGTDIYIEGVPNVYRYDQMDPVFSPQIWGSSRNIELSRQDTNFILVSFSDGFNYISTDWGNNWDTLSFGNEILSISPFNHNTIYANLGLYLLKSTDRGNTYYTVDTGKIYLDNFIYDNDGIHIYALDRRYGNHLAVSDNSGEMFSWSHRFSSGNNIYISIDYSQSGKIYLADGRRIYVSDNYGLTFNEYKVLDRKIVGIYKKPNSDKLYAATKYDLYEITPDTIRTLKHLNFDHRLFSWFPLTIGDQWFYNNVFIGDTSSYEYKSKWKVVEHFSYQNNHYAKIQIENSGANENLIPSQTFLTFRADSTDGKIYRAFFTGDSLADEELYLDLSAEVGDTIPSGNGIQFIGEQSFNIFGLNTSVRNYLHVLTPVLDLHLVKGLGIYYEYEGELLWNEKTLKGAVINGIVYGDTTLVNIDDIEDKPLEFHLSQNYPNPFNPSTKISWQSPVGSHQTLKVYDVLGREVATLVNEFRDAGSYEVEFNASELASGIYYYQLKADEFVETRKMILIK